MKVLILIGAASCLTIQNISRKDDWNDPVNEEEAAMGYINGLYWPYHGRI